MPSTDLDWTQIEQERDQLLEQVRMRLQPGDFVALRAALHKITNDAKIREKEYEQALRDGTDSFINDVSGTDPLTFILRGTLQIETLINSAIQTFGLKSKSKDLRDRIAALEKVDSIEPGDITLLHEIRKLRNGVSHELDAGRTVDPQVALDAYNKLDTDMKAELQAVVGDDPTQLTPDVLVKLMLNRGYLIVEGALLQREMQLQLRKALGIA